MALDNIYDRDAEVDKKSTNLAYVKTFLYMFVGILFTAVVAAGIGYGLLYNLPVDAFYGTYYGLMIGASIGSIILMLIISFAHIKGSKLVWIPYILYATCMGVLVASFTLWLDPSLMAICFGATALVFAIMALIGFLSKGNLSPLVLIATGLLFGGLILGFINCMMFFFSPVVWEWFYWVISFVMLVAVLLITTYDIWRFKNDVKAGATSNDICLFYAFQFYVDFIYILIRILYLVTIVTSRR